MILGWFSRAPSIVAWLASMPDLLGFSRVCLKRVAWVSLKSLYCMGSEQMQVVLHVYLCVYVCVCVRERERDGQGTCHAKFHVQRCFGFHSFSFCSNQSRFRI